MSAEPAYTRMNVDDRRRQLLAAGSKLFATHSYGELSMAAIAREMGVSKALLYHYFPSKVEFFKATVRQVAEEIAARTEPDPGLPPAEALTASLGSFLEWIEENEVAYRKLMQSASSVIEVNTLIAEVRTGTAERILDVIAPDRPPKVRAAVNGWLWLMDGVCLDWLEHRDMERTEVRDLLLGTLLGALMASGATLPSG